MVTVQALCETYWLLCTYMCVVSIIILYKKNKLHKHHKRHYLLSKTKATLMNSSSASCSVKYDD